LLNHREHLCGICSDTSTLALAVICRKHDVGTG